MKTKRRVFDTRKPEDENEGGRHEYITEGGLTGRSAVVGSVLDAQNTLLHVESVNLSELACRQ